MKSPAATTNEVVDYVQARLEWRGFTKKGHFLLRERPGGICDSLAFPHVVPEKNGPVAISVNLGIGVVRLHSLLPESPHAVFGQNIGYALPRKSWTDWLFERGPFSEVSAQDLYEAIVEVGLPFLEAFASSESIIDGCLRYGVRFQNDLHIPAIRLLAGQKDLAVSEIRASLSKIEGKQEAYAIQRAAHLHRLLAYADQEPNQTPEPTGPSGRGSP
jgi:hypothetical protein